MRSKLGLDLPTKPVTICDNEIGALLKRIVTILTAILALSAITIPAFAGDDELWCHFDQGTPGEQRGSTARGDGHKNHEQDFEIESDEDLTLCVGTTTTSTPVEPATTLPPRVVRICIDEQIIEVEWEPDIEDKYEVVKTERDEKHCLPTPPTPTIPQPGLPHVVFPPPPGTGWVCVGSDNVIAEVPRDSNPLVTIWDTPEEAQADCPPVAELPMVNVEAPSTTEATVLPFTGIDPGLGVLAGLAALSLGGILVRRSDG